MNDAATTGLTVETRTETLAETLFRPSGVEGLHARTALFERVVEGLQTLITRHRGTGGEVLRSPPVMSRRNLEKSGYLHSFPHLLGAVSCLHGDEAQIRAAVDRPAKDGGRTAAPCAARPLFLAR